MVVQRKLIITESDRDYIRGLYGVKNTISESEIVITDWLSPDEKYAIFLDELYDITNKVKIGNIWENFDHFKFFLKHSFEVAENISTNIKESVLNSINDLVLTESTQNLTHLKPQVKEMLMTEGIGDWVDGAGKWLSDTTKETVTGTSDFFNKSLSGAQKVISGIGKGEWSQVLNLIKNGALYVARKIRSALYSPVGLILDAILVATGIGKSAQFVTWGIVVALDIYELISGDYENKDESFLERLFFTGVDMIGLVSTGLLAKGSKSLIGSVFRKYGTSTQGLSKAAKESPKFKGILESMLTSATSSKGKMGEVASFLKTKSPMLYKFVSKILGAIGRFISKIVNIVKSILTGTFKVISAPGKFIEKSLGGGKLGTGTKAGLNTTAVVGGVGTYQNTQKLKQNKEINQIFGGGEIKPEFDGI